MDGENFLKRPLFRSVLLVASTMATAVWQAPPLPAQTATARASVSSGGVQGNEWSTGPSISSDGRYVAFASQATTLVVGDTNGASDVFVRDMQAMTTTRVSVDSSAVQGNKDSSSPVISGDGRFVAFVSYATNLFVGDTNKARDVFVRDTLMGTTVCASVRPSGGPANAGSYMPSISSNGQFVAFASYASNLVANDINQQPDVFRRDLSAGVTTRVSLGALSEELVAASEWPSISGDGQYVAFATAAAPTPPMGMDPDLNGAWDIYVRDTLNTTTSRVSWNYLQREANGHCVAPSLSSDGAIITFASLARNMVSGDTNGTWDVFRRNWQAGGSAVTTRVSVGPGNLQGDGASRFPSVSSNGNRIVFYSYATNLIGGDTNGVQDCFLRDVSAGTTTRVSVETGVQGNGVALSPALSGNGLFVAFPSAANNLVIGDTNGFLDVFVRGQL